MGHRNELALARILIRGFKFIVALLEQFVREKEAELDG